MFTLDTRWNLILPLNEMKWIGKVILRQKRQCFGFSNVNISRFSSSSVMVNWVSLNIFNIYNIYPCKSSCRGHRRHFDCKYQKLQSRFRYLDVDIVNLLTSQNQILVFYYIITSIGITIGFPLALKLSAKMGSYRNLMTSSWNCTSKPVSPLICHTLIWARPWP